MRTILISLLMVAIAFSISSQEQDPNLRKRKLRIGERLGNLSAKVLTGKTADLYEAAMNAQVISGLYDVRVNTSEVKYLPPGSREGDYMVVVNFLKAAGIGMLKIEGAVLCDGDTMEDVGLGAYLMRFPEPFTSEKTIEIHTVNGDKAKFILKPVPEIEIYSVNGDATMPIIDLNEDMELVISNPEGSERSSIKIGLLTDVMGARAFNYFADFKAGPDTISIPKEAFSNLEISGKMNAGQFLKGYNYIIAERDLSVEMSSMGPEQEPGKLATATIHARAYATKPVIVKGKQEEGVLTQLEFSGEYGDKIGFEVYKPNARYGIPLSRGSEFGLVSLSLSGQTYHEETHTEESSWTIGNTRYTRTTVHTTIFEFPQLPDEHWDYLLNDFYTKVVAMMERNFGIGFTELEKVTSAPGYQTLFKDAEANTYEKVSRSYKETRRSTPRSISEIFSNLSSFKSTDTPTNTIMRAAGIDGMLSAELVLQIAANKDGKVVLLPSLTFTMKGRDETKGDREGTYASGMIAIREGIPFNSDLVRSNPEELVRSCNIDGLVEVMEYALINLRKKEQEMGFEKIWSIGE